MNPSHPFILRPVATTLLMAAIMLVGIVAYRFLPVSALPQVDYPTIQVQTFYPGASPEVMTSSVTSPLEVQFGQMPSLNQMFSTSSAGASMITLQFTLDVSLDVAEQEVQAAINAAGNLLPTDLPAPPIYAKVNPADAPILTLALTSKTLPLTQVEDLADTRLAQKISQQPGVGLVSISGGQRPAVRVQINPRALAAYGLNIDDLRTTLGNANVNTPKGNFDGPAQATTINANDQITNPNDYLNLVIAYRNGSPVLLKDVATVINGAENSKLGAWANVTPAVVLNVQRQPGANVIQVVNNIKALLPQLKSTLPAAVDVAVLTDRTTTIRASVADVEFELGLSVALVVLVIFLFLRNVPATIIPSLSVPLSLVGTLAVMYLLGFSLDNLSLMALTISTGFVVDDAIVMIENVSRYIEAGETPMQAALKGSGQIGFTIISLTVSLIAVLIPLLFMGDVVGRLFHEFAITLSVTIIISAIVSLTLVPMMCARLLRHRPDAARSKWDLAAERGFDWVIGQYDRALKVVLEHQPLTLLVAVLTLAVTVLLYIVVPKGFFPVQDTGVIQGISVAGQKVSYRAMAEHQQALAAAILKDPDVASLSSFIGVDGTNMTLNSGRFLINLKPKDDRSLNATQIARRLNDETASVQGVSLYLQPVQDLSVDAAVSRTQYQFVLENPSLSAFNEWIPKLLTELNRSPALTNVASDLQQQGLTANLVIDRETAARFGITPATVDNALYDLFGQRIISTIFTQSNQYPRDHGGGSGAADLARRAGRDLSAVLRFDQRTGTAQRHRARGAEARTIADKPSGAVPGDDYFVRHSARLLARRGGHGDPSGRSQYPTAGKLRDRLPGCRGGAGGVAVERTDAGAGGNRYGLHRAGRAVRKFHPSDHDPLHTAVGRCRRARGAVDRRRRHRCDRHHRHHSADRHRQEERHHDDRLCARRRARGRQVSAGGDPSGLPAAFSPDHDDHDGRIAGRAAADAGQRHRVGTPPPTGRRDRWRPAGLSGPHPVHHAGDLPDVRPPGLAPVRQETGHETGG